MLQIARTAIVLPDHGLRRQDLGHGRFDIGPQRLHSGCGNLAHDRVAVTIEHEAWQAVGFAKHPPIVGRGIVSFTQGERHFEAVRQ